MAILGKFDIFGENPCLHNTIGKLINNNHVISRINIDIFL